ncbi:MAG: hypothetical protein EBQ76_07745 [Betaproteobacteria bacterium]|nr:hypothetical protein [Betaproteobacteria bacterium]
MAKSPKNLIPFPRQAIQARIPKETNMTREIDKEAVSVELIADRLTEAGYEVETDPDENIIIVHRTWVNLRLQLYSDLKSIRFRSYVWLNRHLTEEDLLKLLRELNDDVYLPKFTSYRWDDGDLALFASYSVFYTFGLNMPNLIFSMRRFIETKQGVYQDYIKGTAYDYVKEKPPEAVEETGDSITS